MNKIKLIMISIAIILLILGIIFSAHIISHWDCYSSGGKWHTFSNGCADSCSNYDNEEPVACPSAITKDCKCASDKCWNGNKCVDVK